MERHLLLFSYARFWWSRVVRICAGPFPLLVPFSSDGFGRNCQRAIKEATPSTASTKMEFVSPISLSTSAALSSFRVSVAFHPLPRFSAFMIHCLQKPILRLLFISTGSVFFFLELVFSFLSILVIRCFSFHLLPFSHFFHPRCVLSFFCCPPILTYTHCASQAPERSNICVLLCSAVWWCMFCFSCVFISMCTRSQGVHEAWVSFQMLLKCVKTPRWWGWNVSSSSTFFLSLYFLLSLPTRGCCQAFALCLLFLPYPVADLHDLSRWHRDVSVCCQWNSSTFEGSSGFLFRFFPDMFGMVHIDAWTGWTKWTLNWIVLELKNAKPWSYGLHDRHFYTYHTTWFFVLQTVSPFGNGVSRCYSSSCWSICSFFLAFLPLA